MENDKVNGETHIVMVGRVAPQYIEYPSGNALLTDSIESIEIGISDLPRAMRSIGQSYDSAGLIGLDGLFTPYYINSSGTADSKLPSWKNTTPTASGINSSALNPFNPKKQFFESGVFNKSRFFESGHNISFINTFRNVGEDAEGDLNAYKDIAERENADYSEIRSLALRSPVIIGGWGYDTNSQPVPYTTNASGDRVFHPDTLRKPSLWKVGPLDVRWDDSRGVWAANGAGTTTTTGSCCECTCIQYGDISLDGKRTTSQWSVKLETVREQQTNGYLILGAGTFTLTYSSGIDAWTASLSSGDISAINLSGSGVNDLVPDRSGTLTFKRNDNGYTTLTLNMIGTIP